MNPERWKQVEQLYHTALEREPDARGTFLAQACAGDEELRREVEELLGYDGAAESFMQDNAFAAAAQELAPEELSQTAPQLIPGQSIGAYKILALLGRGGMGVVYRARDERLRRDVAIKVLPASFANDADRLRRFEQEAQATSALNHPNILTIYDIGAQDGAPFIVAELLEGEELRAQLEPGALPARRALDYAQQITQGLAAAHEKGIVHRDLKPENLFVTRDGRVKILDFGLAKLRPPQTGVVDNHAPTQKRLTDPGVVMGTVGYMSPEQVRGQEADTRADLFSLGVILYEMLSGRRTFSGDSAIEVMNAILKEEPPELGETNTKVSPQLERIVRRCLEKKPERRFQTASDLGFALEALSSAGYARALASEPQPADASMPMDVSQGQHARARAYPGWRERIAWIVAGVLVLALLALGVAYFRRPALEAEPMRLFVNPPEGATRFELPAISPDGRTLAFIATVAGKTQLWVRPLNSTTARPLVEIGQIGPPFWSPDSQFIGFIEENKLKKIAVAGGRPETLCDMRDRNLGGTWGREGVILFNAFGGGIKRVSANGGAATAVTTVDSARGETGHFTPIFLPDGRHFLFYKASSDLSKRGTYLSSLDGGEPNLLLPLDNTIVGVTANQVSSNDGYVVFVRQGGLLAQSFDFNRNKLLGEPVRLAQQVKIIPRGFGSSTDVQASVSANGVLALIEGETSRQLTWFDRLGNKLGTAGPPGIYFTPRISRDDQRLAVRRVDPQTQTADIYLLDLARGADSTPRRFTFDPQDDEYPLWSPDGSRIVWTSYREGVGDLYWKAASGAGQDEALLKSAYLKRALDWSADGRFILYNETNPQTNQDLWVLSLEDRKSWPWLNTPYLEPLGRFSPDGKWIAYSSNESGRPEIYLQAFVPDAPASGGKWQLTTNGGTIPLWRRDGLELYYLSADNNKLMAVEVTLDADVKLGTPKELFSLSNIRVEIPGTGYARTSDGQRFLLAPNVEESSLTPFTVVQNWMAEVKK